MTKLLETSNKSWSQESLSIERNRNSYPEYGFKVPEKRKASILGVMIEGEFESFYKGKKSPLLVSMKDHEENHEEDGHTEEKDTHEDKENLEFVTSVVEKSPKTASLIVYSSNEVFADDTVQIQAMLTGSDYLNSIELMENSVDWMLEDRALMLLRNRRHFARTLGSLSEVEKRNWEFANYLIPLLGLFLLFGAYHFIRRNSLKRYQELHLSKEGTV